MVLDLFFDQNLEFEFFDSIMDFSVVYIPQFFCFKIATLSMK